MLGPIYFLYKYKPLMGLYHTACFDTSPATALTLESIPNFPMAWYCSGSTNTELVENLFSLRLIKDERVKSAMKGFPLKAKSQTILKPVREKHSKNYGKLTHWTKVDRAHYAPSRPYSDSPRPIGHGATISAPHMHGRACQYLIDYLKPGHRVLDIGSGSGYLTHVLANLVMQPPSSGGNSDGQVIGVDHIPELVDMARNNIGKSEQGRKSLESGQVKFVTADGRLGWKEGAPYDAIHVGAAARELPSLLVGQLRAPGRMFIPIDTENGESAVGSLALGGGQYIWVVDKKEDGSVHKEKVFQASYVPLTDAPRR